MNNHRQPEWPREGGEKLTQLLDRNDLVLDGIDEALGNLYLLEQPTGSVEVAVRPQAWWRNALRLEVKLNLIRTGT